MFRLVEVASYHWDYWENMRLPFETDLVVLNGANGSGKTTVLDQIRILLGATQLAKGRKLRTYLRRGHRSALIRAVVTNTPDAQGRRPFQEERKYADEVTLACNIFTTKSGSLERRFVIADGRPRLDQIEVMLKDDATAYDSDEYATALEPAGVSSTMLRVLTLEEANADQMAKKKPHDLFVLVRDVLGDAKTLQNYLGAEAKLHEANAQLAGQTRTLTSQEGLRDRKRQDVQRRKDYDRLIATADEMHLFANAAKYQSARRKRNLSQSALSKLLPTQAAAAQELAILRDAAKGSESTIAALKRRAEELRAEHAAARQLSRQLLERATNAQERVRQLEKHNARILELPITTLGEADAKLEAMQTSWASTWIALSENQAASTDVTRELESLAIGRIRLPTEVEQTVLALQREGIWYVMLTDLVEPTRDEHAAVEASLGDLRFALVVNPNDFEPARAIAKATRHPGPIYTGERLTAELSTKFGQLKEGVPAWAPKLIEDLTIHDDGTYRDPRGEWVRRAGGHYLGPLAVERQKEAAEDRLSALERARPGLQRAEEDARAALEQARETKALVHERLRLEAETIGLPDATLAAEKAAAELKEQVGLEDEKNAKANEAELAVKAAEEATSAARIHKLDTEVAERAALVASEEEKEKREQGTMDELESGLLPAHKARADAEDLEPHESYSRASDTAKQHAEVMKAIGVPPETIEAEFHALQAAVASLSGHVEDCQRRQTRALKTVIDAKNDYLLVLEQVLRGYRERVIALAKSCGITPIVKLPDLRPESTPEELTAASIEVRFAFGDDPPKILGHEDFSDGQRVLSGLILLLALNGVDRMGFYLLDEPFAHLSLDRTEEAIHFLKSAGAQFILASPTSADKNILGAATQVITMRKKVKGEEYAPHPYVGIR